MTTAATNMGGMINVDDIIAALRGFSQGGTYQGNGVTTFAQPETNLLGSASGNIPGMGQNSDGLGFGANLGTAKAAIAGLQTIGNLWSAFQGQKLAKEQFGFAKDMANANLANQIKSYNTALSDRINSRAVATGMSNEERDAYISKNSLMR